MVSRRSLPDMRTPGGRETGGILRSRPAAGGSAGSLLGPFADFGQDPRLVREFPGLELGVDQLAVDADLKTATPGGNEAQPCDLLLQGREELIRQTDGFRFVASHSAVLQLQFHDDDSGCWALEILRAPPFEEQASRLSYAPTTATLMVAGGRHDLSEQACSLISVSSGPFAPVVRWSITLMTTSPSRIL